MVGGTVNYEGPIDVKTSETGSETVLHGIFRMVQEAQSHEAPIQRISDVIAGKFCYSVMTISAATFAFWFTLGPYAFPQVYDILGMGGQSLDTFRIGFAGPNMFLALKLAIDVLVVACPCALGLAAPTVTLVATSMGAKRGILIKGGDVLENLAKSNTLIFDKTGTITRGKLEVVGVLGYKQ